MVEMILVAPLAKQQMQTGAAYLRGEIPPHVTVVPRFSVASPSPTVSMAVAIERSCRGLGPVAVSASEVEFFGQNRQIAATTIDASPDLIRLHERLLGAVLGAGGVLVEPSFGGSGYRPHVSHGTGGELVVRGDQVLLSRLVLLVFGGATRTAEATVDLGAQCE